MPYYAHSPNGCNRDGVWETVATHLSHVARSAASFADIFGAAEQACAAGLLHDLGKYSEQFQRRLRDVNERGRDHWTIGALAALSAESNFAHFPAVAILGHHVGLEDLSTKHGLKQLLGSRLKSEPDRFTSTDGASVLKCFRDDGFTMPQSTSGLEIRHDFAGDMHDTRMLFSALVDADFLETEAHFAGDASLARRPRESGLSLNSEKCIQAFDKHLKQFDTVEPNPLTKLRQSLLASCRNAGRYLEQGVFTLSAPTGAGKTLAMLAFALEHVKRHELRRIILVMPFLNIIDQTVKIYRDIFSPDVFNADFILESHSLAGDRDMQSRHAADDDSSRAAIRRRLLSENWDAPIVLTTNVQFLESLFAHRPARFRKLHRLAGSVILFDEVQTLPPKLAVATLSTLNRLANPKAPYRASVVFATATQPAFDALSPRLQQLVDSEFYAGRKPHWQPKEVVTDHARMFSVASERVTIQWKDEAPVEFPDLARDLAQHEQVLCIVNLKRHAIELAGELTSFAEHVYHLSTNMCSRHRIEVLDRIRARLMRAQPVRLVATQCVEAGVDLDFPVAYRAFAPLEAIAQAAGPGGPG